jgi:hypothetical protein
VASVGNCGTIGRPRILWALVALISSLAGLTACSSSHHAGAQAPVTPTPLSTSVPTSGATTTSDTAAASTSCPLSSPTGAGLSAPPAGLIAYRIYQPGQLPFVSQVFTDPFINGVDFSVPWKDLEPAFNRFNWAVLDCVFSQADQHGKFVVLTVVPGFESPAWVLALPGVRSQSFMFSYGNDEPARPLPLPWNQPYLNSWFTFLGAVASRYGSNPAFRLIEVGGPTSVSTEMSLPDQTSGDTALPPSTAGSDITEWMRLGYTPATYVAAWEATFSAYHRLFPDQYLALSLFPGLPIGNGGTMDASAADSTPLDVIAAGLHFGQNLVLQENGLEGLAAPKPDPEYNFVEARCGSVVTGLQNAAMATTALRDEGTLSLDIGRAVAAGVDFLEVYESDLVNPAVTGLLTTANAELPANKGCAPLTVSAVPQAAPPGIPATVTATTDLVLARRENINIFQGSTLLRTCNAPTCSIRVSPGPGTTIYSADVGAPGTPPSSDQAIIWAMTPVSRP